MKKLKELKERIENVEINYNYEESYTNLYNTVIDYMNDTQDFNLEYLFEDFIDYETEEEIAKNELNNGGLIRLGYYLGDANLNDGIFKLDGYGNLENITIDDLNNLKDEIIENINDKLGESEAK
jgi:hypothetical protein